MGETHTYDKSILDNDLLFKLLIIGDAGVGKSCLLLRYSDDVFSHSYISTIGVDFKIRTIEMDNKIIKLNMWDTAGQDRFKTITQTFYRGAHGVLLVFDLTDMESFENLPNWQKDLDRSCTRNTAKLLVGTKSDMKDKRKVPYEMAQSFADQAGIPYLETSAKTASNVEQAFLTITAEMKKVFDTGAFKQSPKPILVLDGHSVDNKWSLPCC